MRNAEGQGLGRRNPQKTSGPELSRESDRSIVLSVSVEASEGEILEAPFGGKGALGSR